jgi:hypothetical protein
MEGVMSMKKAALHPQAKISLIAFLLIAVAAGI